jgi:hypothetical protein
MLYRAVRRSSARRIVEIGIGSAGRTSRMLNLARRWSGAEPVKYAALDMFEARPKNKPGLSLKETHRLLARTSVQVQLVPGEPSQSLARAANALVNTDLLVISADYDLAAIGAAWFYVPRMLKPTTIVLRESALADGGTEFKVVSHAEIERLATDSRRRRAA